jgi:hypothetical protein
MPVTADTASTAKISLIESLRTENDLNQVVRTDEETSRHRIVMKARSERNS